MGWISIDEPRSNMSIQYVDPDATEQRNWQDSGCCVWCGSRNRLTGKCFCRYCESCSQCWISPTLADYKDEDYGPVSKWETCPPCIALGQGTLDETIAFLSSEGNRIARESVEEYARQFSEASQKIVANLEARLKEIDERRAVKRETEFQQTLVRASETLRGAA